ncbi:uncharacterized protein LOC141621017 [Silene latifolia]|uniref:uncharacterized protein LOC141621017 n=1 Tax=Silene latifolia TaxID=37657 RepID=UPI003D7858F8
MELNCISPNIDDFYSYYTSAPTSPRRYNLNGFLFLSMPTSPTRDPHGLNFGSRTLDTTGDFLNLVDNFEFEGSKRFYPYDITPEKSQELTIAYADDLFVDGKILPLRPPPATQYERPERKSGHSSTASSPGTRSSLKKVPFLRQKSLWNDGYDPFTSALNKVKQENNVVDTVQLRRAKSLSPLRLTNKLTKSETNPNEFMCHIAAWKKENIENFESTQSRKQRMKKFLLKNSSFGKSEKKEQNVPLLLRKLHYSVRFSKVTPKTIVRISKEMKSLMKHKARIFFCLAKGLGTKCTTKLS